MGYDETFNLPILRLVLNNLTVVQMGRNTLETHLRQFHRPKTCAHSLFQFERRIKNAHSVNETLRPNSEYHNNYSTLY